MRSHCGVRNLSPQHERCGWRHQASIRSPLMQTGQTTSLDRCRARLTTLSTLKPERYPPAVYVPMSFAVAVTKRKHEVTSQVKDVLELINGRSARYSYSDRESLQNTVTCTTPVKLPSAKQRFATVHPHRLQYTLASRPLRRYCMHVRLNNSPGPHTVSSSSLLKAIHGVKTHRTK